MRTVKVRTECKILTDACGSIRDVVAALSINPGVSTDRLECADALCDNIRFLAALGCNKAQYRAAKASTLPLTIIMSRCVECEVKSVYSTPRPTSLSACRRRPDVWQLSIVVGTEASSSTNCFNII